MDKYTGDSDHQRHRTHWRGNAEMASRRAEADAETKAASAHSDRKTWLMAGLLFVGTFVGGLTWLNARSDAQAADRAVPAEAVPSPEPALSPAPEPSTQPVALTPPIMEAADEQVDTSVYYSGCREVRALGRDPLYYNQPGYRPEMDGDGDGIACEPHR